MGRQKGIENAFKGEKEAFAARSGGRGSAAKPGGMGRRPTSKGEEAKVFGGSPPDSSLALLNAVPGRLALLDGEGRITAVNGAWMRFEAGEPCWAAQRPAVGVSYLDACRSAGADPYAGLALQGIREVLSRARDRFSLEYPCHIPTEQRWFVMTVTRLPGAAGGAVVLHSDVSERKREEQALRQSEDQFRAMFNIASVGKAQTDPVTGRLLRVNAALCRLTGYTEAELLARSVRDLTHPEDRESDWASFARMASGEAPGYENEMRYLAADGSIVWVHVSANLIRDEAGKPLRTTAIIQDITSRHKAQAALQRSRDRLELLTRTMSALLTASDPQAVIEALCNDVRRFLDCAVFFNFLLDPAKRRLRYNACGGVAPRVARLVEGLELGASLCGTAAGGACRVVAEHLAGSADPRSAVVRSLGIRAYACHPLLGPENQVLGTLSFGASNRDTFSAEDLELMKAVTDHVAVAMLRRRTEQALRESEVQFRGLADSIPNLAWWANADGAITWYNRRWYEYTGATPGQMEGWGWESVHDPGMLPGVLERWKSCLASGEPFEMEIPLRGADGKFRWFLTRAVPVRDGAGNVLRWFGTNTDISEIREARMVLARSKEQLEGLVSERTASLRELVEEMEHFSYTITHDMRAPLRAMQGFAEITGEALVEGRPEEAEEFLRRIKVAAGRMDCLITDALSYSQAVRNELPLGPVDVGKLLRGMVDTYPEFQAAKARIMVEREIPWVMGNEAGLTQCFSNLLGNALKFVEAGRTPEVRVRADLRDGWLRLWVEDNGIGISAMMLPRVFDMFARGSSSAAGTGIGLALVRKVVNRMGGRVGVESESGRGSRFWVELKPAR